MSMISTRWRRRSSTTPTPPGAAPEGSTTLADLTRGGVSRVVEVGDADAPAVARRLSHLGFVPGAEVTMVHRAPLGDPVVFRVAGYEIALRRAQARCIRVIPR